MVSWSTLAINVCVVVVKRKLWLPYEMVSDRQCAGVLQRWHALGTSELCTVDTRDRYCRHREDGANCQHLGYSSRLPSVD